MAWLTDHENRRAEYAVILARQNDAGGVGKYQNSVAIGAASRQRLAKCAEP